MGWLLNRRWLAGLLALAGLTGVGSAVWVSASGRAARSPRASSHGAVAPGTITTVVGGVGGPGPATGVPLDTCPVSYARGALYVGDDSGAAVRRIGMGSGRLTTVAGDGVPGGWGNGGLAAEASAGWFAVHKKMREPLVLKIVVEAAGRADVLRASARCKEAAPMTDKISQRPVPPLDPPEGAPGGCGGCGAVPGGCVPPSTGPAAPAPPARSAGGVSSTGGRVAPR